MSNGGFVRSRTDYTAFGEEIASGTGLRSVSQGFGASNNLRQKYGLTERDDATGLDHTWFRKHENQAGRWTGPDPYGGSMSIGDPQSFNRYAYVRNDPANFVDPSGLQLVIFWGHYQGDGWGFDYIAHIMYIPDATDGGGGGGGGGVGASDRAHQKNTHEADPCAGKKGQLNHTGAMQHITDRHIQQTPENNGASYYTFSGANRSLSDKQAGVRAVNQEAFENGGAIIQARGNRIAYVYAPGGEIGLSGYGISWGYVGADRDHNLEYTNARTVVVDKNCKSVVTSFPGLPRGISPSDPRIVGTPRWRSAVNTGI